MIDQPWTSRRRVEASLSHQEPDRVPYDLGGTILTGIHEKAYRRLRRHLGLPEVEIEIEDPVQQLGRVHEDVKERLKVDVYGINPSKPRGIAAPAWSDGEYDKLIDEWGIEWWSRGREVVSTLTCGGIRWLISTLSGTGQVPVSRSA